jgi:hypothetical protein
VIESGWRIVTRLSGLMGGLPWVSSAQGKMHMSDTLQAMLDSGALYLALGALICVVLGAGAARRLFQGASKIHGSRQRKD